jgi:hypothetical protein
MQTLLLSHEEVGKLAQQLYDDGIRQKVERAENIGKMIIIDIESGDYEVDKMVSKPPTVWKNGIRTGGCLDCALVTRWQFPSAALWSE